MMAVKEWKKVQAQLKRENTRFRRGPLGLLPEGATRNEHYQSRRAGGLVPVSKWIVQCT